MRNSCSSMVYAMYKRWAGYILPLLLIILSACGGTPQPTPVIDTTAIPTGEFTISVSGDINITFTGKTVFQDDPAIGKILYVYDPTTPVDAPGRGITLVMPADIKPGTYPINSYNAVFDATSGKVTTPGVQYYESPGVDEDSLPATFSIVSEATLSLSSINPMTGKLSFSATNEVDARKVKVEAAFNAIPLMPLPTPDVTSTPSA